MCFETYNLNGFSDKREIVRERQPYYWEDMANPPI